MENAEKVPRKRMFSEEQKAELFKTNEPTLKKQEVQKREEEILTRIQFKANLKTQYLLNCLCKMKKISRDKLITEMIHQEAKKENVAIMVKI